MMDPNHMEPSQWIWVIVMVLFWVTVTYTSIMMGG